jgi:hypothetical protein
MKLAASLLIFVSVTSAAVGQGIVVFFNTSLSKMELVNGPGTTIPVPTSAALYYGIFVDGSSAPVLPLATSSTTTAGLIDVPNAPYYYIPGVTPGLVSMQVRAWSAVYGTDWQAARDSGAYYGETDVRPINVAEPNGAPSSIWQSKAGSSPNRFHPIVVSGVSPAVNDIFIDDLTVAEGSNGVVNAVFTVRMTGTNTQTVTVNFTTQDGTAVAGQDFVSTNGTLTFAPGEVSHSITVAVTADEPVEADESFYVVLSNPVNGLIRRGTATGVITEARITELRIDTAVVFHSLAGRRYAVERSSDLATWTALPNASNVLGVGGPMTVYDPGVGCTGVRYYRTQLLP